jgi:predicted nucleic acid-binding protein
MDVERIFVDANLFLRYLTDDVPEQADAVEELLHKAAVGNVNLVTNSIVIAEIVWTLESFYQLEREEIRDKITSIVNTTGLTVFEGDLVLQAMTGYVEKNVDFIDAYIVAWMLSYGITEVYTFNRKHFKRFDNITVHVPEKTHNDNQDVMTGT